MRRCRGFGDLTRNGEHHRNGMFSGGDHVAERRVHHDHALLRGGDLVDVIRADACARDDLEVGGGAQDFLGHFGGRADRKAVVLADHFGELVFVLAKVGVEINLDTGIAEDLNGCFAELVRNEYFGGHGVGPFEMGWCANFLENSRCQAAVISLSNA